MHFFLHVIFLLIKTLALKLFTWMIPLYAAYMFDLTDLNEAATKGWQQRVREKREREREREREKSKWSMLYLSLLARWITAFVCLCATETHIFFLDLYFACDRGCFLCKEIWILSRLRNFFVCWIPKNAFYDVNPYLENWIHDWKYS